MPAKFRQPHLFGPQITHHPFRIADRPQRPPKYQPVEATQYSRNLFPVFRDKLFHGVSVLRRYGVLAEPPHLIENRSAFYLWLRLCRAVLNRCFSLDLNFHLSTVNLPPAPVRDLYVRSTSAAFLVILDPTAESAATEGNDGVGSAHGPEHARLFEPSPNDRFAPGFDHTGADEQFLPAKLEIAHAFGIRLKIVRFGADLLCQLRMGSSQRAQ